MPLAEGKSSAGMIRSITARSSACSFWENMSPSLGDDGAVEKTRTSTPCGTATSTLRVYQFRHDRTPVVGATSGDEARERVATVRGGCKRLNRAPGTSRNQPILKTFSDRKSTRLNS